MPAKAGIHDFLCYNTRRGRWVAPTEQIAHLVQIAVHVCRQHSGNQTIKYATGRKISQKKK